jgi:hypothetical protein
VGHGSPGGPSLPDASLPWSARPEQLPALCSRTVKDLVAGAGFAFHDRGTHQLKGIPDAWQLYAVQPAQR